MDLVGIAKSFGLLRLPGMFEMKNVSKDSWSDAEVDVWLSKSIPQNFNWLILRFFVNQWTTYAYRDQAQENKRLISITTEKAKNKALAAEKVKERSRKKKANAAWSENMDRQAERTKRKEVKIAKVKWLRANETQAAEASTEEATSKRDRDEDGSDDDWDELVREERMAKKVKKGEVSQKAFDAEFGDL